MRQQVAPFDTPEPDPSKLAPKGPKKGEPRFRAEQYHARRWGWLRSRHRGYWGDIGAARTLEEAVHLMLKPERNGVYQSTRVRVVDTETGAILVRRWLHPKSK